LRARRAASAEGPSIENRGIRERRCDRGGRRSRGNDRCLGRRNERRVMGSDPPSDFGDGGAFKLTVWSPILEGGMPTWREEGSGLEVASEGGKKARLGETYHTAEAEVGIKEVSTDEVFAGVGGMRTVGRGVGHGRVGGGVLKWEQGIREEVDGVSDAGGAGFGYENLVATIVGKRGGQPKTADTVMCPC
jgi:hypothetical protein